MLYKSEVLTVSSFREFIEPENLFSLYLQMLTPNPQVCS